MRHSKAGLLGFVFVVVGMLLFLLAVPAVENGNLQMKDYCWAIIITLSTCLGFGLMMISAFWAE